MPNTLSFYLMTDGKNLPCSCACSCWCYSWLAILSVGLLNIGWSLYSLTKKFNQTFLSGAMTSLLLLVLSLLVDYSYYGRSMSSVLNLLIYNVVGGGESHFFGTEGPLYY